MGLIVVRAALVGLLGVVLALSAGRIFDETILFLAIGPIAVTVVGLLAIGRAWYVRVAVATIAVVGSTAGVVLLAGGSLPGDLVDTFTVGLRRVVSTEWPSPARPEIVGAVGAVVGVTTAVAVALCARQRWHLAVLLPGLATYLAVVAASAPAGPATWWLVPMGLVAVAIAVLRPPGDLGDRFRLLAGERRVATLTLVAAGLALAVSVPVSFDDRADPRQDEVASSTAPLVDPIESVVALRALDPPRSRYEIESTDDGGVVPGRWRTAALDVYDGQRWSAAATLGPIGRRLGPDVPDATDFRITFREPGDELPVPGPPVLVSTDVQTDPDRTVVRLVEPAEVGTTVELEAGVDPAPGEITTGQLATRPIDDIAAGLTSTAEALAGDGTITEQLAQIESTLRDEFALDPGAPGPGLQLALVERFLTDTRRGTEEQFVTAFVLLARSLGVDARVAIGYVVDEPVEPGAPVTLSTGDAVVWPEVDVVDAGWVALDPVPLEAATDDTDAGAPPREVAPAAPQPPLAPPTDTEQDRQPPDAEPAAATDDGLPAIVVGLLVAGVAVAAVAIPIVIVVAVIVLLKRARRRRRLRTAVPAERVRGAWAEATDALVDAGLRIPRSWSDQEIAAAGAQVAEGTQVDLVRLGSMSSAATFGNDPVPVAVAEDAVATLEQVEASITSHRTRWQRARWRLSLRSLRRTTRSPVLGDGRRHRSGDSRR